MWLLNARTRQLESLNDEDAREQGYAILSHVWEKEEITFNDIQCLESQRHKQGYRKLDLACRQALKEGMSYVWIDTCCIDKSSSAELSEAINSMFRWYQDSKICYVYLADCVFATDLAQSRWFTRGWTLQELIAPWKMRFYSKDWELVGDKHGLCPVLERITGIPRTILRNECLLNTVSVAKRMYWAAERETTRPEDIAYCLLGIFDVNIPLLYGEGGQKAFRRLQEAVMRSSTDHSILIWQPHHDLEASVLASSPSCYRYSSKVVQDASHVPDSYERNNAGIRINLPLVHWRDKHFVLLDCRYEDDFSVVSDQTLGSVLPSSPMERFLAERQAPTERLKETSFSGLIGLQVDIIRTASTGLTTVRRNQASRRGMFNFDVFSSDDGGQQLPAILTPLLIVRYDYTPNRDVCKGIGGLIYKLWLQMDHRFVENLRVVGTSPPGCWDTKNQILTWSGPLVIGGASNYFAHILLRRNVHTHKEIPRAKESSMKWLDTTRTKAPSVRRMSHLVILTDCHAYVDHLMIKAVTLDHEPDHAEIARSRDSDALPWTKIRNDGLVKNYPVSIFSIDSDLHLAITISRGVVMATPTYVVTLTSSKTDGVEGAYRKAEYQQPNEPTRDRSWNHQQIPRRRGL